MKRTLLAVALLASAFNVCAEVVEVEYKRFYSHVKKLSGENTAALQFAFGFLRVGTTHLCKINTATIVTQKQDIPLEVSPEQRFLVPKEKALNLADAMVVIDLDEAANLCDMSVQIETTAEHLKTEYSAEDLAFIKQQYEAFFNEMGGFLSFMMPSVKGLTFRFSDSELDAMVPGAPAITNGMLMLDNDWLAEGKSLKLPVKPLRITALAKS
ncbi:DUF2987 domain-containing protein [Alteromonas lipolytica]|uniref:DUF2987 domain-containing protein n=1 Tax=Alteromonas lipolytica TaxID=1856405 RepID=A0A1E8FH19_9ALTE|nr:DUF2987 domain-containing protein [Alteromonas lipolytica]OFI35230.1 hypothetical protein BFC17_16955 [Alteromonas lipolytica]GGF57776.1 hypothetical protein GCM10011338_07570 [Alteromonas lipolytica]